MNIKILLIGTFLLLQALCTVAQTGSDKARTDRVVSVLSVGQKQAEEIAKAMKYHVQLIRKIVVDTTMDRGKKREMLKRLHTARQKRLDSMMTPQQRQLWRDSSGYTAVHRKRELLWEEQQRDLANWKGTGEGRRNIRKEDVAPQKH